MKRTSQALIVLLIAVGAVGLTMGLQQLTAKPIAAQQRELQNRALLDVLPTGGYDNQPLEHPLGIPSSMLDNSQLLGVTSRPWPVNPVRLCCARRSMDMVGALNC